MYEHEYPKTMGYYSQYEKEHPEEVFNTSNRINEAFVNVPEWIQRFDFTLPEGYYTRYGNELCIDKSKTNRIRFHKGLLSVVDVIFDTNSGKAVLFVIYANGEIYPISHSDFWGYTFWGYTSKEFKYSAMAKHFDQYVYGSLKIARKYLQKFFQVNYAKIHRSRLYQNLQWNDAFME